MSDTTLQYTPLAPRGLDGLAIIGRTRHDLMGIRYEDGEGGNGTGSGDDQGAGDGGQGGSGNGSNDNAPWTKENFDPERAHRLVENLRKDLADQKAKTDKAIADAVAKSQQDFAASLAKALGGGEQEETDPAKLREKVTTLSSQIAEKDTNLTKAQADAKAARLEREVAILAGPLGGNARLLLKNEQFKNSIASAEPTDEAALTAAIKKALQENAELRTTPSRSGSGEHTGATVQSLEAQLKAATEKKDWAETIRLKQAIAAARRASTQQ